MKEEDNNENGSREDTWREVIKRRGRGGNKNINGTGHKATQRQPCS